MLILLVVYFMLFILALVSFNVPVEYIERITALVTGPVMTYMAISNNKDNKDK